MFKDLKFITGKKIGRDINHFKGLFADEHGQVINVIAFNRAFLADKLTKGQKVDLVGHLEINEFDNNSEIQLNIVDTSIDE